VKDDARSTVICIAALPAGNMKLLITMYLCEGRHTKPE